MEFYHRPSIATMDTFGPIVGLSCPDQVLTSLTPFTLTITLSEAISTTLTAAKFSYSGVTFGTFSGSGTSYTVLLTPQNVGTAITVQMPAGQVVDASGNSNYASNTLRLIYRPTLAPTLAWTTAGSTGAAPAARSTLSQFTAKLNFNQAGTETVSGVTASSFTVSGPATVTVTSDSIVSCDQLSGSGKVINTVQR